MVTLANEIEGIGSASVGVRSFWCAKDPQSVRWSKKSSAALPKSVELRLMKCRDFVTDSMRRPRKKSKQNYASSAAVCLTHSSTRIHSHPTALTWRWPIVDIFRSSRECCIHCSLLPRRGSSDYRDFQITIMETCRPWCLSCLLPACTDSGSWLRKTYSHKQDGAAK